MSKSYSIVSISTSTQSIVINGDYSDLFVKDNTSTFTLATEFEIQNHSLSSANKKYKVSDSAYSSLTDRTTIYVAPELITSSTSTSGVSVSALPTGSNLGPNFGKITNTTHYLLDFKQGNFVVLANQINTTASSLSIPGRHVLNYGEDIHQSILKLTESFASAAAPNNPAIGQLWYDIGEAAIKVYNGSSWGALLSSGVSGIIPISQGGTGRASWQTGIMKQSGGSFTTTNLTNAEVTTGLGYTPVNKAGDTMTGNLTLNADPTADLGAATKKYVDARDYLNLDPLAGILEENIVPTYSDFQFSLGTGNTQAFALTDDQNIEVAYFHVNTPTNKVRAWRAYRFVETENFIFDPEPLTVSFQTANERISGILNVGTQFAYLELKDDVSSAIRRVLVKTGGSSKSTNWTLFADVTAITSSRTNMFLLVDAAGDRILRTTLGSGNSNITLDVFDSSLTLLRSQIIYNIADVTNIDQAGEGRTSPNNTISFGYTPPNCVPAFTWNKFTENLLMTYSAYYINYSATGAPLSSGPSLTVSWNIPKSWFIDGSGTLTNLVPIKSSGFRYHKIPDSTWDTNDGGMSSSGAGTARSVTTDEYAKKLTWCIVGTWDNLGFTIRKFANQDWSTIGSNIPLLYNSFIGIPDAAPWSKNIYSYNTHVVDDNVQFIAVSNKYGTKLVNTKFSTSTFSSSSPSSLNDALKLDGATWQYTPDAEGANVYSTTVLGSSGVYSKIYPGRALEQITVSGGVRTYTLTAFTLPSIPSTISSVTGISWNGQIVYNGNSSDRQFWALVKANAPADGESMYIAHYASGSWSNIYGPFMVSQIAAGNANRGDTQNQWSTHGCAVLTDAGRFLSSIGVSVIGGRSQYILEFNVNTGIATVHAANKFAPPTSPYTGINVSWGTSFGYSEKFGYFCTMSTGPISAAYFVMSKNISGAGAELTEEQWFTGSTTRYQIAMTTEPAIGLFAYVQEYPIFIGGYYTKIPSANLALIPNATQYVYAEKTGTSRDEVTLSVSVDYLPNSFSRVALAEIITDAENVLSLTSYSITPKKSTYQPLDADLTAIAGLTATSGFLKKTAVGTWALDTNIVSETSSQIISITGDATGSGSTSISLTLADSGVTAGTYTKVTVDAKGRVTTATTLTAGDIPGLSQFVLKAGDTMTGTLTGTNFYAGAGTTSSPSLSFSADTNTGIYSPGAEIIGFVTTGTERMRIDSSGNVGIGTATPQGKLDISGAESDMWPGASANNGLAINGCGINFGTSTIASYLDNSSIRIGAGLTQKTGILITGQTSGVGSTVQFRTGNAERMRLTSAGNLGIGTASPEVIANYVNVESSGTTGGIFQATNGTQKVAMYVNATNGYAGTRSNHPFLFVVNAAERMRIDTGGNVGIGATPSSGISGIPVLQINSAQFGSLGGPNGHFFITSNAYPATSTDEGFATWNYINSTARATKFDSRDGSFRWYSTPTVGTAGSTITFTPIMSLGFDGQLLLTSGTTSSPSLSFVSDTNTGIYNPIADTLAFVEGGVEAMRIDSAGNLSIGTTSNALGHRVLIEGTSVGGVGGLGSSYLLSVKAASTSSYLGFNHAAISTIGNESLLFGTNNVERMRISSAGNVAIGTSTAVARLHVGSVGNNTRASTILTSAETAFRISASQGGTGVGALVGDFGLEWNDTKNAMIKFYRGGSTTGGFLAFTTDNDTERMRLDAIGNLGLGTSSTTFLAEFSAGSKGLSIMAAVPTIALVDDEDTTNDRSWIAQTSGDMYISNKNTSTGRIIFQNAGAERMRIDTVGRILIGTGSAAGQLPSGSVQLASGAHFASDAFGRIFVPGQAIGGATYAGLYGLASTYLAYYSGGWKSLGGGTAAAITIDEGIFSFCNSNTVAAAGSTLTWTTRLMVDQSGNIGIGTSSYTSRLSVYGGDINLMANATYIKSVTTASASVRMLGINQNDVAYVGPIDNGPVSTIFNAAPTSLVATFYTTGTEKMRITSAGEVYIAGTSDQGAYNLQVNGTGVWGAGAYVNGSDARLKENIQTLNDGLSVVNQLRPVTFKYKSEYSRDQSVQPGFIAQELQQALDGKDYSEGIVQSGPEHLNVAYQSLIPLLTKAVQELSEEVKQLKAEIQILKGSSQ